MGKANKHKKPKHIEKKETEARPDLQDGDHGKDLSYLNEMPQMGGYEGVVAGAPPPKEKVSSNIKQKNRKHHE
jgi:hypothetical protein